MSVNDIEDHKEFYKYDRDKTDFILRTKTVGAFLLRPSSRIGWYSFSIHNHDKVIHFAISYMNGEYVCENGYFSEHPNTVDELIQIYSEKIVHLELKGLSTLIDEEDYCCICTEGFKTASLICGHKFCNECILHDSIKKCPLCRSSI
jgi:hypothetical protein